jgi:hypothetical protein
MEFSISIGLSDFFYFCKVTKINEREGSTGGFL